MRGASGLSGSSSRNAPAASPSTAMKTASDPSRSAARRTWRSQPGSEPGGRGHDRTGLDMGRDLVQGGCQPQDAVGIDTIGGRDGVRQGRLPLDQAPALSKRAAVPMTSSSRAPPPLTTTSNACGARESGHDRDRGRQQKRARRQEPSIPARISPVPPRRRSPAATASSGTYVTPPEPAGGPRGARSTSRLSSRRARARARVSSTRPIASITVLRPRRTAHSPTRPRPKPPPR